MNRFILFFFYLIKNLNYHPKATSRLLKDILIFIIKGGKIKPIYNITYNLLRGCYLIMKITKENILKSMDYKMVRL